MEEQAQEAVVMQRKGTKINRMVMHGFKSFAKFTEVPFTDKYNCIIGPNGSGKSNVLDSLCFVLGKSSSKALRAEKTANLIYNGGKSKKPAKQGEVSLYFDNSQNTFPTDEKEVKISRIVKQSGTSVYKINDQTATRQQMLDLLAHAKINPQGYNIILQGDIVRFVEMHPNERRELIGEIAGISQYEEKKRKAVGELERVNERLKETEIVLAERATYLKELKKDRDQALKYKEMNDKVKENKASYLKLQIDRKQKEHDELSAKKDQISQKLSTINEKISVLKEENNQRKVKIDDITKEIEKKGEVEQIELNREVEALKIKRTKQESRLETVKAELQKITARREDLKQGMKEIEGKIGEVRGDSKTLQQDIEQKEKERIQIQDKIDAFKKKHKMDNLEEIEQAIETVEKRAEELATEAQSLREEQHELIRQQDKINHELQAIDAQIEKVKEVEKEHKGQLDIIKQKKKEFKSSTLELNKILEEDATLASKLVTSRKDLQGYLEKLSKLEVRQASSQEASLTNIALKRILDMKNKIPGIFGTVADLGQVDSKYATALEISAGGKIKSVVVKDDKTAADCIRFLKDNKLGTVTFLPLNKIKSKESKKDAGTLSKSKGAHGFALDLVTFDSKFKTVFEYVLGNAIIVDSIDVARRLGIGVGKFVTLDGDIAETSGAMQGGYRSKKRQGLGFKEQDIEKEMLKVNNDIAEHKQFIDSFESRRTDIEEQATRLRTHKAELEGEIIRMEKSLHLDSSDLDASLERKELLKKEDQAYGEKLRAVENKISATNSELAKIKMEKEKHRQNISQLRSPTLIAELNSFEEKKKQLDGDIVRIDSQLKVIQSQSEGLYSAELQKSEKIIEELDKDEKEFSQEEKDLTERIGVTNKELDEKEEKAKEFYAKFKGLFGQRSELDKQIQDSAAKINTEQEESRGLEMKVNTISLKSTELSSILTGLKAEFAQYEGVPLRTDLSEEELRREIQKFERMREQIGSVNMRALEIFDDVEKQYNQMNEKKEELEREQGDVVKLMEEIEGKKTELFMKTYNEVNEQFQEFFTMLTAKGGQASLVLENEQTPFEEGVRINVKITGSKFLDIRSLSGGEKTMTALAFIFAIQEHDPASFYVLDEVDAALDKHNAEKLAKMVARYSGRAQYIMISHNDAVISQAETLYGVSMNEHGMSQVVSLKI